MKASVGDLVLSCLPYAHVLMGKERGARCDECFAAGSLQEKTLNRCSKCKTAYYCSAKCQRAAWVLHKTECEAFLRTKPDIPTESVRLLARLVIKYEKKHHLVKEKFQGLPGSRCFDDLVSHVEDLLSDPVKSQHFVTAWETLRAFLGPIFVDELFPGDPRSAGEAATALKPLPCETDDDFNDEAPAASSILVGAAMFGRISVNSFSILDDESNPIGVGVYLPASKLDHACEGNITPSFDGVRLNLRARSNIESVSFSNLSLCYVDPLAPTWERKENLLSQYFFNCNCSWCCCSSTPEEDDAGYSDADANADSNDHSTSSALRVISHDSRLNSFSLSARDTKMLSLTCGCAATSCPQTGRPCSGVVELTIGDKASFSSLPPSSTSTASKLKLTENYVLDLTNASFSECSLCFCRLKANSLDSLLKAFVDVTERSADALKAIEEVRKEEGRILLLNDERKRNEHFEMVLSLCQKLIERQTTLHPSNIFALRALDQAFDVCVHLAKWKEALFYGEKTLAPFRQYHPNPHPTLALQAFKVAKLWAYLEPPSAPVVALLVNAVEMLESTHGKNGRIASEAKELLAQLHDEMRVQRDFQGMAIEDAGDDSNYYAKKLKLK